MYFSGQRLTRDANGARLFLHKRFSRILPLYWLITTLKLLIALAIPAAVLHNKPDILHTLTSYILFPMLNNEGEVRPIHGVAWTLLHEMFFYYIFSIALILKQSPHIFSSITILSIWLIGLFTPNDTAINQVIFNDLNLMFITGMILAATHQHGIALPKNIARLLLLISVVSLAGIDIGPIKTSILGSHHTNAAIAVISSLSLSISHSHAIKNKIISLGDSSYSLYLLHPILAPAICVILLKLHITSPYIILLISFFACISAADILYKIIEKPLNIRAKIAFSSLFIKREPIITEEPEEEKGWS